LDEFPADCWRWWLTANAPEGSDSDFSFARFAEGCNSDLADNFGNLANRVLSFAASKGAKADADADGESSRRAAERLLPLLSAVEEHHLALETRKAADAVRRVWSEANRIVAEAAPWAAFKRSEADGLDALRACLTALKAAAAACSAILPESSETVLHCLGETGCLGEAGGGWPRKAEDLSVSNGSSISRAPILFPKIDAARIAELEAKYG